MNLETILQNAVGAFHIKVGDISFWAPYLRNDNFTQDPSVPRGLGKSSPAEILAASEYIVALFPDVDGEAVRQKLIDGSLPEKEFNYKGVDCSGFAYYVMDQVYREFLGKNLVDDLSVPKSHVLNGAYNLDDWKAAHALSAEEAEELPEDVPMSWVVDTFQRNPVNLCRVAGLVSDYSAVAVRPDTLRVGDLLHVITPGETIPHVLIALKVENDKITVAHSGRRDPNDIGGVAIEVILLKTEHRTAWRLLCPASSSCPPA